MRNSIVQAGCLHHSWRDARATSCGSGRPAGQSKLDVARMGRYTLAKFGRGNLSTSLPTVGPSASGSLRLTFARVSCARTA